MLKLLIKINNFLEKKVIQADIFILSYFSLYLNKTKPNENSKYYNYYNNIKTWLDDYILKLKNKL